MAGRPRVLVVEDELSIGEVVSLYLRRAGFQVTHVRDGRAALDSLAAELPEMVVLDLMLPKVGGLEITRWLRDRGDTPIIMLTARGAEADRIAGLEMGADDYVVKPFSPQELVSRVRAVLRRTQPDSDTPFENTRPLARGDILIDPSAHRVTVGGEECILTPKEFDLLHVLARHPQQVLTRGQLLDMVWGYNDYVDPGTVTVHVRRLREKIEPDPSRPRYIQTVWGVGYRFEP
jgi:DNA-binding response OmpR family regulator